MPAIDDRKTGFEGTWWGQNEAQLREGYSAEFAAGTACAGSMSLHPVVLTRRAEGLNIQVTLVVGDEGLRLIQLQPHSDDVPRVVLYAMVDWMSALLGAPSQRSNSHAMWITDHTRVLLMADETVGGSLTPL